MDQFTETGLRSVPDSLDSVPLVSEKPFPQEYKRLRAQNQTFEGDTPRWSDEYLLSEYVSLTDGLIGKLDGTIPMDSDEKGTDEDIGVPTSVIWLDKSARPVSWLKRALWSTLARKPGTDYRDFDIPPQPRDFYLNIDKETWLREIGLPTEDIQDPPPGSIDISKIAREHMTRIRALFSTQKITEDNLEEAWNHPTILDGQHVAMVDETRLSGASLKIARLLLSHAIPDAKFSGLYWSSPGVIALNRGVPVNGKIQVAQRWVPVWYHSKYATGRGVGDRDQNYPELAENSGVGVSRLNKIGRYVLSTPPHDLSTFARQRDIKGDELRQDIKRLSSDLLTGKIFYRPAAIRGFEDFETRAEAINKLGFNEWKARLNELAPKSR